MSNYRNSDMTLEVWINQGLSKVTPGSSIHLHVDELLTEEAQNPQAMLTFVASSYVRTIELLSGRLDEIMPVLVIPLKDAEDLVLEPPHGSRLSDELSSEPPSISLVHRDTARLPRLRESYRRTLVDFHLFDKPMPNVKFFYECSRSEEERIQGCEYARTVFGEHYSHRDSS